MRPFPVVLWDVFLFSSPLAPHPALRYPACGPRRSRPIDAEVHLARVHGARSFPARFRGGVHPRVPVEVPALQGDRRLSAGSPARAHARELHLDAPAAGLRRGLPRLPPDPLRGAGRRAGPGRVTVRQRQPSLPPQRMASNTALCADTMFSSCAGSDAVDSAPSSKVPPRMIPSCRGTM